MMSATRRQADLFAFLQRYFEQHGTAPSFEEMAKALGYSTKSRIHALLGALEERGLIRRIPERPRAIEIVEPGKEPATPDQAVASILRADQFKWLQRRAAADGITLATCLREVVEEARAA